MSMGSKKKRQETASLRSSSMRRDSVSATKTAHQTTHHVSVGCMSGIFHFVSKYHNRRKFLTFGGSNRKHHEREATTAPPQNPGNATCQTHDHQSLPARVSIEVPRSPVIPAEIRRSSLNSPMAVARLMGISETPVKNPVTTEMAAEKRRKLLGALEKCDEDLEALKSIIKAVRAVQTPPSTPPPVARGVGVEDMEVEGDDDEMVSDEGPSPVSVLDHRHLVTRSPNMSYSKRAREEKVVQQQHEQIIMHQEQQQRQHYSSRKRPVEEDNAIFCFQNRAYPSSFAITTSLQSLFVPVKSRNQFNNIVAKTCHTGPWSSTTRESVIEVCKDVEWGQRREVGSVVLVVQEIIFRDLIDEIIKEMDCFYVSNAARSLPCEACTRKLSF